MLLKGRLKKIINLFTMVYLFTYICKKITDMKKLNFLFIAIAAITLASCGGSDKAAEKATYSLDTETSSLKWKGSKSAEYFHVGSVQFTEGTIEMEGENLVAGKFTIDMNSIVTEDETLPEDKKAYLTGHLKDTVFFFTAENPNVTVTVNGYENGKLDAVISVLGQDMKQSIPVKVKSDAKKVTINGKFDLDFAALNLAGMQPDPESGEKVLSVVSYDLNLTLNKK
jgi:polyisoprenoid-binding protein YceI